MSASGTAPLPLEDKGRDLEILFFNAKPHTPESAPIHSIHSEKPPGSDKGKERLVYSIKKDADISQTSYDRDPWMPIKQQENQLRLPLIFNQFVVQFRLACHRLCHIVLSKIPVPRDTKIIEDLAVDAVARASIYCAVHGLAYAYATFLNQYSDATMPYLEYCRDILSTGYPASLDEVRSLAVSEVRMRQNVAKPIDELLDNTLVKRDQSTLPINYRASCWFHSACAFMMPASRGVFDFLKRHELDVVLIDGVIAETPYIEIVRRAISLKPRAMHHSTLKLTDDLVRFMYESFRILCERRSAPMLNMIEIFANLYRPGDEEYGLIFLQRDMVDAIETAANLVTPFTSSWQLSPTKSMTGITISSEVYSSKNTFVKGIDYNLIPRSRIDLSSAVDPSGWMKSYAPVSPLDVYSAKAPGAGSQHLVLKGLQSPTEPTIAIRTVDTNDVFLHIAKAGYPPRLCFYITQSRDNEFHKVAKRFDKVIVSDTVSYSISSCVFYGSVHYKTIYRDPRTRDWYMYNDLLTNITKLSPDEVRTDSSKCNIIMLVRSGVVYNYATMQSSIPPPSSPRNKPATSPAYIYRYGEMTASDLANCNYVLETNGLSPTQRTSAITNLAIELRSAQSPKIICIDSIDSVNQILKVASTLGRDKVFVIYVSFNEKLAESESSALKYLAANLLVMVSPQGTREVCALTQQICDVIKHSSSVQVDKTFIEYLWKVYSDGLVRRQHFELNFITPKQPVHHRWIPYVKDGHYILICHNERTSYLEDPKVKARGLFNRETVEVWGQTMVNSLDALDIPYSSKWFIYESNDPCYLEESERKRFYGLLKAANCKIEVVRVE